MDSIREKYAALLDEIKSMGAVAVAFSGGVDSSFLLAAAHEALGENAIALTAKSCFVPLAELKGAEDFCRESGIRHIIFEPDVLAIEGISHNPKNRCYLCKSHIMSAAKALAGENGISHVIEGSNTDDSRDYRPGAKAIAEQGIKSPLVTAGFSKAEIRAMSEILGLPTYNKRSSACLASRFPYGDEINETKLAMVDKAEQLLSGMGFTQLRVRIHDTLARVEILPAEFDKVLDAREEIVKKFKEYGFSYVSLDLQGYRMGSMNEVI